MCSRKRAKRDEKTLALQEAKARGVVDGTRQATAIRFLTTTKTGRTVDEESLDHARCLIGLKGYLTNIEASQDAGRRSDRQLPRPLEHAAVASHVHQSPCRPAHAPPHPKHIEAHQTIVFAALATSRHTPAATG